MRLKEVNPMSIQSGLIVSKFGGSSVKDASSMMYCVDIVKKLPRPTVVVISATWNTTNMLEDIARASIKGDNDYLNHQFHVLVGRHDKIAKDLFIYEQVKDDLIKLYNEARGYSLILQSKRDCPPYLMDALYSIGERLSSVMFAASLNYCLGESAQSIYFDIREVLITDSTYQSANPDFLKIDELAQQKIKPLLVQDNIIVTQGFIGKDSLGHTTTLGREGSDYTGSILASVLSADQYFIWTDVNGVKVCDPKLVATAKTIKELTYDEAETFAKLGARVLFERTMEPVKEKKIPIFVGSTKDPNGEGTWIKSTSGLDQPIIGFTTSKEDNDIILSVVGRQALSFDLSKEFAALKQIRKNPLFVSYVLTGDVDYKRL